MEQCINIEVLLWGTSSFPCGLFQYQTTKRFTNMGHLPCMVSSRFIVNCPPAIWLLDCLGCWQSQVATQWPVTDHTTQINAGYPLAKCAYPLYFLYFTNLLVWSIRNKTIFFSKKKDNLGTWWCICNKECFKFWNKISLVSLSCCMAYCNVLSCFQEESPYHS